MQIMSAWFFFASGNRAESKRSQRTHVADPNMDKAKGNIVFVVQFNCWKLTFFFFFLGELMLHETLHYVYRYFRHSRFDYIKLLSGHGL